MASRQRKRSVMTYHDLANCRRIRQYRTRLNRWGLDKKVKTHEMKAIVRKRQRRKLVETHKGDLNFILRGTVVNPRKIDRWMARNDIAEDVVYSPYPAVGKRSSTNFFRRISYRIKQLPLPRSVPTRSLSAAPLPQVLLFRYAPHSQPY